MFKDKELRSFSKEQCDQIMEKLAQKEATTQQLFLLKSYIVQNGPKSFHFWATFVGEFVTKAPPKLVQSGYFAED